MALLITDECIACAACREECPSEAIEENDPIYIIDPDR
jgi:ferredoxin